MGVSILKAVVGILGAVLVIMAVFMGLFTLNDKAIPGVFENVMLMGIAGLLGLLAPSKDVMKDPGGDHKAP